MASIDTVYQLFLIEYLSLILMSADNTKYIGSWRDGRRNGFGAITYLSGDRYEG
jgi:hypothetical protein